MRRAPWRRRRGLRRRHRPRRNPRVVVAAKPVGGPVAGRARLRPVLARQRGRCAEIPDVTLHEPDGYKYSAISSRSPFEMTANMTAKRRTIVDSGGQPRNPYRHAGASAGADGYLWMAGPRSSKPFGEWVGPARSSIIGAVGRE